MTVARLVNLVAYAWLTGGTGTHEKKGFLDDLPRGIFSPGYSEVNFFSAFPRTNATNPLRRFFLHFLFNCLSIQFRPFIERNVNVDRVRRERGLSKVAKPRGRWLEQRYGVCVRVCAVCGRRPQTYL